MNITRAKKKQLEDRYGAAITRIIARCDTDDIAVITSYLIQCGQNNEAQKKLQPKQGSDEEIQQLTKSLQYLGYSFISVEGVYTQKGHQPPVLEINFFVTKPLSYSFKAFSKDMINVAQNYKQGFVVIWNHEDKKAALYRIENSEDCRLVLEFNEFSFDAIRKTVWSLYKGNRFKQENDLHRVIMSVKEAVGDGGDEAPVLRYVVRRKRLFGEQYW